MPQLTEKTAATLPDLIQQAGITVPIYRIEETKTLVKFWLYGHAQPITIRKPKASRTGGSAKPPQPARLSGRRGGQQTRGKKKT